MQIHGKKLSLSILLFLLFIPFSIVYAGTLKATLTLKSIQQISSQEKHDEVYFLVGDLSKKEKSFYTVPGYRPYFKKAIAAHPTPTDLLHSRIEWKARNLKNLNNVLLWHDNLAEKQKIFLMVSLVEADFPPFDVDDSLGSFKLMLENHDGKLTAKIISYHNASITKKQKTDGGYGYTVTTKKGKANYQMQLELK